MSTSTDATELQVRDLDSGKIVTFGGQGPEGQQRLSSLTQLPVRLSSPLPPPPQRARVPPVRTDTARASSRFFSIGSATRTKTPRPMMPTARPYCPELGRTPIATTFAHGMRLAKDAALAEQTGSEYNAIALYRQASRHLNLAFELVARREARPYAAGEALVPQKERLCYYSTKYTQRARQLEEITELGVRVLQLAVAGHHQVGSPLDPGWCMDRSREDELAAKEAALEEVGCLVPSEAALFDIERLVAWVNGDTPAAPSSLLTPRSGDGAATPRGRTLTAAREWAAEWAAIQAEEAALAQEEAALAQEEAALLAQEQAALLAQEGALAAEEEGASEESANASVRRSGSASTAVEHEQPAARSSGTAAPPPLSLSSVPRSGHASRYDDLTPRSGSRAAQRDFLSTMEEQMLTPRPSSLEPDKTQGKPEVVADSDNVETTHDHAPARGLGGRYNVETNGSSPRDAGADVMVAQSEYLARLDQQWEDLLASRCKKGQHDAGHGDGSAALIL